MKNQSWAILVVMLMLLSCGSFSSQIATEQPQTVTPRPGSIATFIVQTVQAAATLTQRSLPTATETPIPDEMDTATPTQLVSSPTATSTFFFVIPTATNTTPTPFASPIPIGGYSSYGLCNVTSFGPPVNQVFKPGVDFDATWTIKNTSPVVWEPDKFELVYVSGADMSKDHVTKYDISKTVGIDETITLIVDMFAPHDEGSYTAVWSLKGATYSCNMAVTIRVEK